MFRQAAYSDPGAFPEASFDSAAERKPHFGFGGGARHCLGHFIARGDMPAALAILARRPKHPVFDREPEFLPDGGNTGANRMSSKFTEAWR